MVGGGCGTIVVSHLVGGSLKFDGANFKTFSLRRYDFMEDGNFRNFKITTYCLMCWFGVGVGVGC